MPSQIIRINGTFDKLCEQINQIPNEVIARGADRMLGTLGSEARKIIGSKQEDLFDMKSPKTKWFKGKFETRRPAYDNTHGWYKGQATANRPDGTRIIGFSYESTAYKKSNKKRKLPIIGTMSVGYAYSLINNLWGQPANYRKKSAPFHSDNPKYTRYWGSFKKGIRPARATGFTESSVKEAIAPTMERAETELTKLLKEAGF